MPYFPNCTNLGCLTAFCGPNKAIFAAPKNGRRKSMGAQSTLVERDPLRCFSCNMCRPFFWPRDKIWTDICSSLPCPCTRILVHVSIFLLFSRTLNFKIN